MLNLRIFTRLPVPGVVILSVIRSSLKWAVLRMNCCRWRSILGHSHVLRMSIDSCHRVVQNNDMGHSRYLHVELNASKSNFIGLFTTFSRYFIIIIEQRWSSLQLIGESGGINLVERADFN